MPTAIIVFFGLHWYLSLLMQTMFLHRYAAHAMYTLSGFWERVFYILTYIFQGSSFLSPHAYGIMHRMHHAYADTPQDPHSPKYSTGLGNMMWKTKDIYNDILNGRVVPDREFTRGVPYWSLIENIGDSWMSRLTWGTIYTLFYIQFATAWWQFLLLPIHFLMGPVHGAVINWFAHKYGYVNFKVGDTAKNLLPVDILMMGESYHNNHHKWGGRADFGYHWWEQDPTYWIMRGLDIVGVIKLKKSALEPAVSDTEAALRLQRQTKQTMEKAA